MCEGEVTNEDGVTEGSVIALHVDLGTEAVVLVLGGALEQLVEEADVLFHGEITVLAVLSLHSLLTHGLLIGVIHEGLALKNQLSGLVEDEVEVVGGVGHDVGLDVQEGEIFNDAGLELLLLLGRVGIIETDEELAVVSLGVEGVQHGSLDVTDVEVAGSLRRETSHDLTHDGVGEIRHATQDGVVGLAAFLLQESFLGLPSVSEGGQRTYFRCSASGALLFWARRIPLLIRPWVCFKAASEETRLYQRARLGMESSITSFFTMT